MYPHPPTPPQIERAGYLDGERAADTEAIKGAEDSIFRHMDANGDGFISFAGGARSMACLSPPAPPPLRMHLHVVGALMLCSIQEG